MPAGWASDGSCNPGARRVFPGNCCTLCLIQGGLGFNWWPPVRQKTSDQEALLSWDFPGGPAVENPLCYAGDAGSIPDQGTKIPHALEQLSPSAPTTEPSHSGTCVSQQICTMQQRSCMLQLKSSAASPPKRGPPIPFLCKQSRQQVRMSHPRWVFHSSSLCLGYMPPSTHTILP